MAFNSIDIINEIKKRFNEHIDLHNYKEKIYIRIYKDKALIANEKIKGLGGLPSKSSGKAVILISMGIDSPVAAWLMMKRGIEPIYLHFHAFNNNELALKYDRINKIRSVLDSYTKSKFYLMPSYLFQAEATKAGRYENIMFKRFMLKVAEKIAKKENAKAIIIGDALGQVSSQTLENITSEGYGIKIPILRPLIGFGKDEIIELAKKINTYEYSLLPYPDVCSIFSRHPKTKSDIKTVKNLEKNMHMNEIVKRSMKLYNIV